MADIHKGQRFTALKDFPTRALTHWKAPFTGDVQVTIPQGTILVVASDSPPSRLAIVCVPEDRATFVFRHIPEDVRQDPKFAGISFVMDKKNIGEIIGPA